LVNNALDGANKADQAKIVIIFFVSSVRIRPVDIWEKKRKKKGA
jgi:hypothetical protein